MTGASDKSDRVIVNGAASVSALRASVPSAKDEAVYFYGDVAVVQPLLEPAPSGAIKVGRYMLFVYCRWSSFAIGFDILRGGAAAHFGPAMFGVVHIKTFVEYAQAIEARRAATGTGAVHESAVRQDAPETGSGDQYGEAKP